MTPNRNDPDPQALAEQKIDFTAEGAPAPDTLPSPPPPRLGAGDGAAPLTAKLHRATLTLKRESRAR